MNHYAEMVRGDTSGGQSVVGAKIKLVREIMQMTQKEFSEVLGYSSTGTLSLIERGLRGIGRKELLIIEDKFNVPAGAIISETPMGVDDLKALQGLMTLIKQKIAGAPSKRLSSIYLLVEAASAESQLEAKI